MGEEKQKTEDEELETENGENRASHFLEINKIWFTTIIPLLVSIAVLFRIRWFQQKPFIQNQDNRIGILSHDFFVTAICPCHLQINKQINISYFQRSVL